MTQLEPKPSSRAAPRTVRVPHRVRWLVFVMIAAGVIAAFWPLLDAGSRAELSGRVDLLRAELAPWLARRWADAVAYGRAGWPVGLVGLVLGAVLGAVLAGRRGLTRGRAQGLYAGDYRTVKADELRRRLRLMVRSPRARERLLAQARARGLDERGAHEWVLDHLHQEMRGWR